MNLSIHSVLILIALILTIVSIIKPSWPLIQVAVLLVCAALLASWYK